MNSCVPHTTPPTVSEEPFMNFVKLCTTTSAPNFAGAIDNGYGRHVMKGPGVIEDLEDIMSLPIKVVGDTVVSFRDVATVKRAFKDPLGFARINGEPALSLEVKKRVGSNIIEVIEQVKAIVAEKREFWPESIKHTYILRSNSTNQGISIY